VVLAGVHQYKEAAEVLSDVLGRQPNRVEALCLRASARRYLDDLKGAGEDIGRALELDPTYPEALVERGIIRRLQGDDAGARADWLKVVQMVPSGPDLEQAQRNLQLMEVEKPRAKKR
jgi:Flp pilus assembly protein TadD